MSYFDQYNPYVIGAANQYNIPVPVLQGLISTESSWNPFASPGTTSAYGFTQLTNAAASEVGADKYNPISNIYGGAQYLSSMPGATWQEKLAHYYQGPHASIAASGLAYADKVMTAANKFINSPLGKLGTKAGMAIATGGASLLTDAGGIGGPSDWVAEIKDWIVNSSFFQRLALALVALILILGAIYTLKGKSI
jgi:hypothetical protein